jgi:hypothetical protein
MEQVAHAVGIIQAGSMRFEGTVDSLRAEVRRVAGPVQPADVPWLEQVRGDACRASPEAWQANGLAADAWSKTWTWKRFSSRLRAPTRWTAHEGPAPQGVAGTRAVHPDPVSRRPGSAGYPLDQCTHLGLSANGMGVPGAVLRRHRAALVSEVQKDGAGFEDRDIALGQPWNPAERPMHEVLMLAINEGDAFDAVRQTGSFECPSHVVIAHVTARRSGYQSNVVRISSVMRIR